MTKRKSLILFLLFVLFTQACNMQELDAARTVTPTTQKTTSPTPTRTLPTPTEVVATATQIPRPSKTPKPNVTITAVKGNLFIRRGPDMAYNPIDVLYTGTTAKVIMRDALSKWAQIIIPKSKETGWVSVMTQYSNVEGDLSALPQFKIVDWPIPGYVRNCTDHLIVLYPGEIFIESGVFKPENLAWVYPGHYHVFDVDMPDPVELDSVDTREGLTVDIRKDGAGERRKCE